MLLVPFPSAFALIRRLATLVAEALPPSTGTTLTWPRFLLPLVNLTAPLGLKPVVPGVVAETFAIRSIPLFEDETLVVLAVSVVAVAPCATVKLMGPSSEVEEYDASPL